MVIKAWNDLVQKSRSVGRYKILLLSGRYKSPKIIKAWNDQVEKS